LDILLEVKEISENTNGARLPTFQKDDCIQMRCKDVTAIQIATDGLEKFLQV
jgi:hypothetical protein